MKNITKTNPFTLMAPAGLMGEGVLIFKFMKVKKKCPFCKRLIFLNDAGLLMGHLKDSKKVDFNSNIESFSERTCRGSFLSAISDVERYYLQFTKQNLETL